MKPTNAYQIKALKAGMLALTLGLAAFAPAQELDRKNESPLARTMGITQKLGDTVPKDATFKDESGKTVHFGDYYGKRPIVVIPIFYACRTGCAVIADSVYKTLAKANKAEDEMIVGRDLDIVMVSIHPKETPELARSKKNLILDSIEPPNAPESWRKNAESGWHLLTGDLASIHKVTDAIGFKYKYDAQKDLINHPTCTVFLTPTGRISSYTIGNDFPTTVVKSDLATAGKDEIGEKADQSMMFGCIMLDPATGKYRVVVENVMRVAGFATVFILAFCIINMSVKSKRAERLRSNGEDSARNDQPLGNSN